MDAIVVILQYNEHLIRMKLNDGFLGSEKKEEIKCPLCSSVHINSSPLIRVPELQSDPKNISSVEMTTSYECLDCGHRFTSLDVENRKVFNQGFRTLLIISIMIILLLIVLL